MLKRVHESADDSPQTPPGTGDLTDGVIDGMIHARLTSLGIDLGQLPEGSRPDQDTGAPGQDTVLAELRAFVRQTVGVLAAYRIPVPDGTDPADDHALRQQTAAPQLYPSRAVGRTGR
ncbi:hypothetical protein ACWDZ4_17095 [Streptomyces sp. NPDC003016]